MELAAIHAPENHRYLGGCFSSLVRVDQSILTERGQAAAKVHGITDAEIAEAPDFRTVWSRFLFWIEDLLEMTVAEETDSENEEPRQTQLLSEPPLLLLGGHNSVRFDFPMLLAECLRHCVPCDCFRKWLYVDTLHVVGAFNYSCKKLQCLVKLLGETADLRAHRALDDTVALRHVSSALAERVGCTLPELLRQFALELDFDKSLAVLSILLVA